MIDQTLIEEPVCGMTVPENAPIRYWLGGTDYFFCASDLAPRNLSTVDFETLESRGMSASTPARFLMGSMR